MSSLALANFVLWRHRRPLLGGGTLLPRILAEDAGPLLRLLRGRLLAARARAPRDGGVGGDQRGAPLHLPAAPLRVRGVPGRDRRQEPQRGAGALRPGRRHQAIPRPARSAAFTLPRSARQPLSTIFATLPPLASVRPFGRSVSVGIVTGRRRHCIASHRTGHGNVV